MGARNKDQRANIFRVTRVGPRSLVVFPLSKIILSMDELAAKLTQTLNNSVHSLFLSK